MHANFHLEGTEKLKINQCKGPSGPPCVWINLDKRWRRWPMCSQNLSSSGRQMTKCPQLFEEGAIPWPNPKMFFFTGHLFGQSWMRTQILSSIGLKMWSVATDKSGHGKTKPTMLGIFGSARPHLAADTYDKYTLRYGDGVRNIFWTLNCFAPSPLFQPEYENR